MVEWWDEVLGYGNLYIRMILWYWDCRWDYLYLYVSDFSGLLRRLSWYQWDEIIRPLHRLHLRVSQPAGGKVNDDRSMDACDDKAIRYQVRRLHLHTRWFRATPPHLYRSHNIELFFNHPGHITSVFKQVSRWQPWMPMCPWHLQPTTDHPSPPSITPYLRQESLLSYLTAYDHKADWQARGLPYYCTYCTRTSATWRTEIPYSKVSWLRTAKPSSFPTSFRLLISFFFAKYLSTVRKAWILDLMARQAFVGTSSDDIYQLSDADSVL